MTALVRTKKSHETRWSTNGNLMKTKFLVGSLVLFCAVAISAIAAYFSVVGLAAMFAAAFIPVAIMGTVLEGSKLVAAGWLHSNWKNPHVSRFHRGYLAAAVVALMLITSMGIYGYLAKAHLEQAAPTATIQVDLDQKQAELDQLMARRTELQTQQEAINKTVNTYLESGKATGASTFMRQQKAERNSLQTEITEINKQITAANVGMAPLKKEVAGSEAKLGPLKYVGELFGWEDPDSAVKLIILILMFAFDPLAVAMMISGTITLGEWQAEKRTEGLLEDETDYVPPEPEEPVLEDSEDVEEIIEEEEAEEVPETIVHDEYVIEDDEMEQAQAEEPTIQIDDDYIEQCRKAEEELAAALEEIAPPIAETKAPLVYTVTPDELDALFKGFPVTSILDPEPPEDTEPADAKAQLLALLEGRPDLLEDIVEAIEQSKGAIIRDPVEADDVVNRKGREWLDIHKQ